MKRIFVLALLTSGLLFAGSASAQSEEKVVKKCQSSCSNQARPVATVAPEPVHQPMPVVMVRPSIRTVRVETVEVSPVVPVAPAAPVSQKVDFTNIDREMDQVQEEMSRPARPIAFTRFRIAHR